LNRAELERLLADLVGHKMAGKLAAVLTEVTNLATGGLTNDLDSADPGATTKDLDSKAKDTGEKPSSDSPSSGHDENVDEEPVEEPDEGAPDDAGIIETPLGGGRPGKVDPALP
jgi:hypothetical protein